MTKWSKFFQDKIYLIAQEKKILDIGGGFKMMKSLGHYKDLFAHCDYQVIDVNPDYQPDIVGDIQDMGFVPDNSVDAIICKAVLEHVPNPIKACQEMHRILRPGGKCLIYVPFIYSYHAKKGHGEYQDFYRYTLDGLRWLLRDFTSFEYSPVRGRFETIVYLLPLKIIRRILSTLARQLDRFFKTDKQSSGYNVFVVK